MRAFIVDDDPITLTLVSYMLIDEGIDTRYALSPLTESFYEDLKKFKPDVIVLDLYLNNEDGVQIAHNIREIKELNSIPILAISGSHLIEDKLNAFVNGFSDYLEKPFTKKELCTFVKRYGSIHSILRLCDKITKFDGVYNAFTIKPDKE